MAVRWRSKLSASPASARRRLLDELRGRAATHGAPRPFRIRLRARARPSVRGVRRLARRVPPGFAAGPSRGARRRRPKRTGECLPLALGACDESGSATPTRAISQPPRRPRAPRAADRHQAPGAGARRRPLGRPGVRRSARFAAPAASRGRRPCCHCRSAASRAERLSPPSSRPGAPARSPRRARRLDAHRSGRTAGSLRRRSTAAPCTKTAAATRSIWSSSPGPSSARHRLAIAARHDSLTDLHVPPRVAAALADELRSSPTPRAACCAARRSPAIPSTPSWPQPQPRSMGRRHSRRWMSCCAST